MKMSAKELFSSAAYQKAATGYSKNMITAATIGIIWNYFSSADATFIGSVLLWFAWGLFGTSILLALPVFFVHILIVSAMSSHTDFPSGIPNDATGKLLKFLSSTVLNIGLIAALLIPIFFAGYFGF